MIGLRVGILQLSDIHLKNGLNSVMGKLENINSVLKSDLYSLDHVFLVFSGDMAFSGQIEEYEIGVELVRKINNFISNQLKKQTSIIIIPGNHDCDFSMEDGVRKSLISSLGNENADNIDLSIINHMCKQQENFFIFSEEFNEQLTVVEIDKLFKRYEFQIDGYTFNFNCLNTSWFSQLHEQPGQMFFPIKRYEKELKHDGDLNITVLHHPFNWYNPENGRCIKKIIERCSDTILTGHEHVSSFKDIKEYQSTTVVSVNMIEGGALQENDNPNVSEFNLIKYDFNNNSQTLVKYKWSLEMNMYCPLRPIVKTNFKNSETIQGKFETNKKYRSYLDEIGFPLRHSNKTDEIKLDDIYIYPEAKKVKITEKNRGIRKYINLKELFVATEVGDILVTGEEKYGKTSLCKQLYKRYLSLGLVPVYIEGETISTYRIDDFNKLLYKNFSNQYSNTRLEEFKQLSDDKKVIIVDDIHKVKLSKKYIGKLINNIGEVYSNLLITADELFNISEFISSETFILDEFKEYQLVEFGHKTRMALINKWNSLGLESQLEEKDLILKTDDSEKTINSIIGRHFVPASPFFILIILQTIENGQSHYLRESTLGHYYEYLIMQPFMEKPYRNDEIETIYTYVSELAYDYFKNGEIEKTDASLRDFNKYYCETYSLSLDFKETKEKLKNLNIIQENENGYIFKYRYVYYFFVARYLASNIDNYQIRESIRSMCANLYYNQNADILMFLTHHSKSPFILDVLLNNAKEIFAELKPADLNVTAINKLIDGVPKIIYKNTDVIKNRKHRSELEDQVEREGLPLDKNETHVSRKEDEQTQDQLELAFNSINIMGQILKNYYGSIKGAEKLKLGKEIYSLGLRALNGFLKLVNENLDQVVTNVKGFIRANNINNITDIEKISRRITFDVCCIVAFSFIKKISTAVGTRNLEETFKQILKENDTYSVNLIDLAIKLDYIRKFPNTQLKSFTDRIKKAGNNLSYNVLRQLVVEHLYMFDVDFQDKQRICEMLGISIDAQISIGLIRDNNEK